MNTKVQNSLWVIRLVPGMVFLLEGVQKFLYAETLGIGRFVRIGIPYADFLAPFVGTVEIVCGSLVIIGLFTRLAVIPLIIVMIVSFVYTKWPILLSKGFLPMFHEYRTDYAMTLTLVFLLIAGAGRYSFDSIRLKESRGL